MVPLTNFSFLSSGNSKKVNEMSFLRIVLPQYISPSPVYSAMSVSYGSLRRPVELAEDMVLVAKKTLHQRLWQDVVAMIITSVSLKKGAAALLKRFENE